MCKKSFKNHKHTLPHPRESNQFQKRSRVFGIEKDLRMFIGFIFKYYYGINNDKVLLSVGIK